LGFGGIGLDEAANAVEGMQQQPCADSFGEGAMAGVGAPHMDSVKCQGLQVGGEGRGW
jgi:hypothetical protein